MTDSNRNCWDDKTLVTLAAVVVLGALEIAALLTQHDGAMLLPIAALIAGLGGYSVREWLELRAS